MYSLIVESHSETPKFTDITGHWAEESILKLANIDQLRELTPVHEFEPVQRLAKLFWPGPLTLVLPVLAHAVSPKVMAGLATIAVRMPNHPVALQLLAAANCPIAAPSANRSGKPSPTTAQHVLDDMDGRIDAIVDGGLVQLGLESTVVQVQGSRLAILRLGAITEAELALAGFEVVVDPGALSGVEYGASNTQPASDHFAPASPGMKYRHYAPDGRLQVVQSSGLEGSDVRTRAWIREQLLAASSRGERTAVLTFAAHAAYYTGAADWVCALGKREEPHIAAQGLYAALRQCNAKRISYIIAEGWAEDGIGAAIMNRLKKAADGRVIRID
jgi:L-threonylcarbamoyladenylate synthase